MSTLMASSASLPNSYSINGPSFLPLRFASISAFPKLNEFRLSKLAVAPKKTAIVGPVRARISDQSSPDYVPDANLFKVEAILRSWKVLTMVSTAIELQHLPTSVSRGGSRSLLEALAAIGIGGVTVSEVKGFGAQGGVRPNRRVAELSGPKFEAKVKIETVVSKDQVEAVIDKIRSESWTGEIGDGKIFVTPVSDIIRVRTDERGDKAVKRSDVPAGM